MPEDLHENLQLVHARARRRFQRGLKKRPMGLIKKLRKAKKEAPPNEKPTVVKTHLRDMIVVPEMIGSVVGIYNGKVCFSSCLCKSMRRLNACVQKVFNSVEIKPEMTGHYLAEFSCSYKPVKHGRPGVCLNSNFAVMLRSLLLSLSFDRLVPHIVSIVHTFS